MSLTPEQIAEELAIAMFTFDGVCSPHDWGNANATARAHFRECARACVPIIKRICTQAVEAERARVVGWLRAENGLCDCFAREANECACGAWDDYKTKPLLDLANAIERGEHLGRGWGKHEPGTIQGATHEQ